ncbi:Ras guanine-nucleotide exchange factors catalytic domain profile [Nakaseomyces glabratus]|nr:Ras guanine-nucleotide exchange factors catalytic domain profile [Nakaseomyces glabratus]KAH7608808.1 Ras guanine-nucleotide exchange factors catalytic domain profile [Nakaseomyces glabratus]KAH7615175.1 Ras guanine-nucleotide exchange factors catalytic domain profile [Nakaseomyces glabratus]
MDSPTSQYDNGASPTLPLDTSFQTASFHTATSSPTPSQQLDAQDISKEIEQLRLYQDNKRISFTTPVVNTSPLHLPPDITPRADQVQPENQQGFVSHGLGISLPQPTDNTNIDDTITSIDPDITTKLQPDSPDRTNNSVKSKPDDFSLSHLFIIANHEFDPSSLQNKEDASICLPFKKNDVAFVHVVDESGWGEVTLIKNNERGWVPFNYFQDTVHPTTAAYPAPQYLKSRLPLESLLSACAQFLTQQDGSEKFKHKYFNDIRDGVKTLLELTKCVSRSDELVKSVSLIRRARKALLADWYDLMMKADHYKKTSPSAENITTLIQLTNKVTNKAFTFYNAWSTHLSTDSSKHDSRYHILNNPSDKKEELISQNNSIEASSKSTVSNNHANQPTENQISEKANSTTLLEPPFAIARLTEIHNLIFQYIGLILGRLQMVTNNPAGYETLESVIHQIIIILRELLYISKTCAYIMQQKFQKVDQDPFNEDLDQLLSMVSDMVSTIKVLVTMSLNTSIHKEDTATIEAQQHKLISIVASMTPLINNTVLQCHNYLRLIGDFKLETSRSYMDFQKIRINPQHLINRSQTTSNNDVFKSDFQRKSIDLFANDKERYKRVTRYSTITPLREDFFDDHNLIEGSPEKKSFARDSVFLKYQPTDSEAESSALVTNSSDKLSEEDLIYDSNNELITATCRGLVFKLTDELDHPSSFFVSTFLLNFRSFMKSYELVTELINRFDLADMENKLRDNKPKGKYSTTASKLKNRRRLICSVFNEWMESYWDYNTDFECISTMINFFNEGMADYLPRESKMLIQTAAKLILKFNELKKNRQLTTTYSQLCPINVLKNNGGSMISQISTVTTATNKSILTMDERLIDEYELTHIPHQTEDDLALPLPVLNLGTFSLISKENTEQIHNLVYKYRNYLNEKNYDDFTDKTSDEILKIWFELKNHHFSNSDLSTAAEFSLVILNPLEVAKQLTILESLLFMRLTPFDIVNYKANSTITSSNVAAITSFTNQLSQYVMNGILTPRINDATRTTILKAWLRIALSALYLRNFNSVASIMTAIQNHSITRLTGVWQQLSRKDTLLYEYLSRIIHPNHNFKVYRQKLKKIIDDSSQGSIIPVKSHVPVVPFFNLFLQDITFIHEGNSTFRNPDSFRPNKPINVDKFYRITKIVTTMQFFQVGYNTNNSEDEPKRESFFRLTEEMGLDTKNIASVPLLQELIVYELWKVNNVFSIDSDRAYQLSLQIQPRN